MLNHDHDKRTDLDVGAKVGIVKSYDGVRGQPPIMDLMTLNVSPLSYESDS